MRSLYRWFTLSSFFSTVSNGFEIIQYAVTQEKKPVASVFDGRTKLRKIIIAKFEESETNMHQRDNVLTSRNLEIRNGSIVSIAENLRDTPRN